MISSRAAFVLSSLSVWLVVAGCSADDSDLVVEHGEVAGDDDAGEESGTQYTKAEIYEETRGGARLRLSYDPTRDAFVGTVENTTGGVLDRVRIEVHLSNGVELGPTTPGDLGAGQIAAIALPAAGNQFETWRAHPEVGRDEHRVEGGNDEGGEHEGGNDEGGEESR